LYDDLHYCDDCKRTMVLDRVRRVSNNNHEFYKINLRRISVKCDRTFHSILIINNYFMMLDKQKIKTCGGGVVEENNRQHRFIKQSERYRLSSEKYRFSSEE